LITILVKPVDSKAEAFCAKNVYNYTAKHLMTILVKPVDSKAEAFCAKNVYNYIAKDGMSRHESTGS